MHVRGKFVGHMSKTCLGLYSRRDKSDLCLLATGGRAASVRKRRKKIQMLFWMSCLKVILKEDRKKDDKMRKDP